MRATESWLLVDSELDVPQLSGESNESPLPTVSRSFSASAPRKRDPMLPLPRLSARKGPITGNVPLPAGTTSY